MKEFENDRIYEVAIEDCYGGFTKRETKLFKKFEDAQEYMNNKIELFNEENNLPLQDKGENYASYYIDGWYDENHYDITIFEKEIF